jgi:hypothetical protein
MRKQRNKHKPDGRLPSGGLPHHLQEGLPLPRGDLQCQWRAGPDSYKTGPPGFYAWGPRGTSPPIPRTRHPERSRFVTSEGSDQRGVYRMAIHEWWSPPGRNGPVGTSAIPTDFSKRSAAKIRVGMSFPPILLEAGSVEGIGPPISRTRHPERSRFVTSEGSDQRGRSRTTLHEWWSPPGRNGPVGTSPPETRIRHPERRRCVTSEGSDNCVLYQILRPDESGLRMTSNHGWSPPGRNGPVGTSPPIPRTRHPERGRCATSEGSDQRGVIQIRRITPWRQGRSLRPDKSGLRMTVQHGWSPPGRNGPVGSSPPRIRLRHRERCPDKFGTSVAICQTRSRFWSDCFVPAETGLAMTIRRGWSPPGRNGPVGTSAIPTNFSKRSAAKIILGMSIPPIFSPAGSIQGIGPPKPRIRHPERRRCLTSEGSDKRGYTGTLGSKKMDLAFCGHSDPEIKKIKHQGANEKGYSVSTLCEEKKFSWGGSLGTPSFSLIARQTEDSFTVCGFS